MSAVDNADWGLTIETAACERWNLDHVANDTDAPDWHDAIAREDIQTSSHTRVPGLVVVPRDTPVECKAAKVRISDGNSQRKGQWWIRRSSHEKLLENDGAYALGVYDPSAETSILRLALIDASTIDATITSWSGCGDDHRADQAARIPWSRVFDSVRGDEINGTNGLCGSFSGPGDHPEPDVQFAKASDLIPGDSR